MIKKIIHINLLGLLLWGTILPVANAIDSFHPEADSVLEAEHVWLTSKFKKESAEATTAFRVWFPYKPEQVWEVLIDINSWKNIHKEYVDSRTLSVEQFKKVEKNKPTKIKDFYTLIGSEIFSSTMHRKEGKAWTSYAFSRFNLPWPLKDKWTLMKAVNKENNAAKGEYSYEYKLVTGNVKSLKGVWHLLPIKGKEGWTEFRGEYSSDPGIRVPRGIARSIIKSSVKRNAKENLDAMRRKFGESKSGESKLL